MQAELLDNRPSSGERKPWARTSVNVETARRLPQETARFLRATFDAAIADTRSLG